MSGTPTAVLFDVDGTLVDSNYLHTVCWWEAFSQAGHDVSMARIHRTIGMGSGQLPDALLPADRDRGGDGAIDGGISRGELLDAGAAEACEGPAELLAALPESILCPRR